MSYYDDSNHNDEVRKTSSEEYIPPDLVDIPPDSLIFYSDQYGAGACNDCSVSLRQNQIPNFCSESPFSPSNSGSLNTDQYCSQYSQMTGSGQFLSTTETFPDSAASGLQSNQESSFQEHLENSNCQSKGAIRKTRKREGNQVSGANSTYEEFIYTQFLPEFQTSSGIMDEENPSGNTTISGLSNLTESSDVTLSSLNNESTEVDPWGYLLEDDQDRSYLDLDKQILPSNYVPQQQHQTDDDDSFGSHSFDPVLSSASFEPERFHFQPTSERAARRWDLPSTSTDEPENLFYQSQPYPSRPVLFESGNQEPGPSGYEPFDSHLRKPENHNQWNYRENSLSTPESENFTQSPHSSRCGFLSDSYVEDDPAPHGAGCSWQSQQGPGTSPQEGVRRKPKTTQKRDRLKKADYEQLTPQERDERKKYLNKVCSKKHSERKKEEKRMKEKELFEAQERNEQLLAEERKIMLQIKALEEFFSKLKPSDKPSRPN